MGIKNETPNNHNTAIVGNGSGIAEGGKQKARIPQYMSCRFWQYHVCGSWRIINYKTK